MLILTRKLGESITIGDKIKVSVLGIHGRQVRIGIDAPSNVVVHREEIYVKIQEENRRASKSLRDDIAGVVDLIKGKMRGKPTRPDKNAEIDYRSGPRKRRPKGDQRSDRLNH